MFALAKGGRGIRIVVAVPGWKEEKVANHAAADATEVFKTEKDYPCRPAAAT